MSTIETVDANIILVLASHSNDHKPYLLLGLKPGAVSKKQKKKSVGSGYWMPPGGCVKVGDKSQKHAAQRELLEETGLNVPVDALQKAGILKRFFQDEDIPRWNVNIFRVSLDRCESLIPNHEFRLLCWFPAKKIPTHQMLPQDANWIPTVLASIRETYTISICGGKKVDEYESIKIEPNRRLF